MESYDAVASLIMRMGQKAKELQSRVHSTPKADGSPVTEADLAISREVIDTIHALYPDYGIISEEELTPKRPGAPGIFVLDPVDGTDVYAQGLPCWAVSLGLLDADNRPVGAWISAPRFGIGTDSLFVRLDPGSTLLVNGSPFVLSGSKDDVRQITVGSDCFKKMDFLSYRGKVRCLGTTVVQLLLPVLAPKIGGAIHTVGYIWDYAASHAVLLSQGMDIWNGDGKPLVYDETLLSRGGVTGPLYAGTRKGVETLRRDVKFVGRRF